MISDKPIYDESEDQFNREKFALQVVNVVEKTKLNESYTIGLFEKWGAGKTSLLKLIQRKLELKDYTVIEFTPWLITEKEQLIKLFFSELKIQLVASSKFKKNADKLISKLSNYQALLTNSLELAGFGYLTGIFKASMSHFNKDKSLQQSKKELQSSFSKLDKKLIIFIDDIDRLDKKEIELVFKLIKVIADFQNTVYILPFDHNYVSNALDHTFPSGGRKYLEKIIQLPIEIPKITIHQLYKYLETKLKKLREDHLLETEDLPNESTLEFLKTYFLQKANSPRIVIRFINSLHLKLSLLKGEVNHNDLMVMEAIYHIHPELYTLIKHNKMVFLQVTNNSRQRFLSTEANYNDEQRKEMISQSISKNLEIIPYLSQVFPQLNTIYSNEIYDSHHSLQWYEKRRICSGSYFERYFTYSVNDNEISDLQFNEFLTYLSTEDYKDQIFELKKHLNNFDVPSLIFKLQYYENSFNSENAKMLALNISLLDIYTKYEETGFSLGMDTRSQLVYILKLLIKQVSDNEKNNLIHQMFNRIQVPDFLVKVWIETRYFEYEPSRTILSKEQSHQAKQYFIKRILEVISIYELILLHNSISYSYSVLSEIALHKGKEVKNKVNDIIESSNGMLNILHMFSQKTYSSGQPEPYISDFNKEYYDLLKNTCDINHLYNISKKLFGHIADIDKSRKIDDKLDDVQLVARFQKVHELETFDNLEKLLT